MADQSQLIAALQKRLDTLEAQIAIRNLVDRFPHLLDGATRSGKLEDFQKIIDIHTDDCHFDHPIGKVTGAKALTGLAETDMGPLFSSTHHHTANINIHTLDVEKGHARAQVNAIYTHVYKPHPDVKGTDIYKDYQQVGGVYDFEFVRTTSGEWKLCRNDLCPTWFHGLGRIM